jgi:FSR family fosmidomycin resistance protein-like MFS transporter
MNLTHNRNLQPAYWGLLHGVNDLAAGFLLAAYTLTHGYSDSFLFISIYAILGFGGQLPVGFWLDKQKDIPLFAKISITLLPLSLLFFFVSNEAAIICSGIASAFVHVTGGTICLQVHENKSGPLGLFTAPGVLGLTIGGLLGEAGHLLPFVLLLSSLIITAFIFSIPFPPYKIPDKKESELDSHDLLMLLILLFMCFRSFLFDVINYVAENYEDGLLYIGVSAFLGKFIGGFVADKISTRRFIYFSLLIALFLFQFGKDNIYMLCSGIVFLQSSVPVTLLLMSRSLPFYPATASAFSLGISIVLAGLPLFLVRDKKMIYDVFNIDLLTSILFFGSVVVLFVGGQYFFRKTYR